MPFAQRLLLTIPPVPLCLLMIVIAIGLSVGGLLITRRYLSHQKRKIHNDVAGPLFATIGVVYAVLLAFVVVAVWEGFDRSSLNVRNEANAVADLYLDAVAFPEAQQQEIRVLLADYVKAVVNSEWRTIQHGEVSIVVNEVMKKIWGVYAGYAPRNATEEIFLRESVDKLNQLGELRRMRIIDSGTGVHGLIWFVLIMGGIITIVFSFFFGTENHGVQMIMTIFLAVLIALILFTVLELDYPFSGDFTIRPTAFQQLEHIKQAYER